MSSINRLGIAFLMTIGALLNNGCLTVHQESCVPRAIEKLEAVGPFTDQQRVVIGEILLELDRLERER